MYLLAAQDQKKMGKKETKVGSERVGTAGRFQKSGKMSFREKRKRVMKLSIFLSLNCVVVGRLFRIMISIIGRGGGSRATTLRTKIGHCF